MEFKDLTIQFNSRYFRLYAYSKDYASHSFNSFPILQPANHFLDLARKQPPETGRTQPDWLSLISSRPCKVGSGAKMIEVPRFVMRTLHGRASIAAVHAANQGTTSRPLMDTETQESDLEETAAATNSQAAAKAFPTFGYLTSRLFDRWKKLKANRLPEVETERLRQHALWLSSQKAEGARLVLDGELQGMVLRDADLREARISANLRGADLRGTKFTGADMDGAILWDSDLSYTDFSQASGLLPSAATNFCYPLSGADLTGAALPDYVAQFPALANIAELCKNAGALFLTLITGDAVIQLMALKSTDLQLVTNTGTVTIPFLNAEVPSTTLFWLGPTLVLVNYVSLLFYMQRLWELFAGLPAVFPDGLTLNQKSYPWIATDLIRNYFPRLASRPQAFATAQRYLFVNLIYTVVPLSLVAMWARYLVAHDKAVTSAQIVIEAVFAYTWYTFLRLAKGTLRRRNDSVLVPKRNLYIRTWIWFSQQIGPTAIALSCAFLLTSLTYRGCTTGVPDEHNRGLIDPRFADAEILPESRTASQQRVAHILTRLRLSPFADLHEKELSKKPDSWWQHPTVESVTVPADLQGRDLRYANFDSAFIVKGDMRYTNIERAYFTGADMRQINLSHTNARLAMFAHANMAGSVMDFANLQLADLRWTNVEKSQLIYADLRASFCRNTDFQGAAMNGANLYQSGMPWCNFRNADLSNADLRGADLQTANLTDTKLDGASYYASGPCQTHFPRGFDPKAHGMYLSPVPYSP